MPVMRLVILLVAAGAAIAAAMLVRGLQNQPVPVQPIQSVQQEARAATREKAKPAQSVLVTAEDVRVGTYLTPEHFVWQPWPEDSNTTAFFVDTIDPDAIDGLIGAVVRIDMMAGEPFTANNVHAAFGHELVEDLLRNMRLKVEHRIGVSLERFVSTALAMDPAFIAVGLKRFNY